MISLRAYAISLLVVFAGSVAILQIEQNQYNGLLSEYNALYENYNSVKQADSRVNGFLNGSLVQVQRQMELLLQNYDQRSLVYRSPAVNTSISVWGRNQTVLPHAWTAWALLDTFVNRIDISTNASARFMILDVGNYVLMAVNQSFVPFVDYTGNHFMRTERISQGCAFYLLVIRNYSGAPIAIRPNVTATYAPTSFLTGQCSLSP